MKNSSIFAREQKNEYDPAHPTLLERPLAGGRPLSTQIQGNAFGGRGLEAMRKEVIQIATIEVPAEYEMLTRQEPFGQGPHEQATATVASNAFASLSPSKTSVSPTKSSLSKKTGIMATHGGFDVEHHVYSDDEDPAAERILPEGRGLHHHAKSVTFDQAPPQINEYEMTTPDPSSVASGSREGSYDSYEDEEDITFDRGSSLDREDSFDASLEDTDKTPVVLPEDWRFMSPDHANSELAKHEENPFEGEYGSPAPTAQPGAMEYRPHQSSVASIDSNGQTRPLPPLPAMSKPRHHHVESAISPSATVERISSAQRSLPSPPQPSPISKTEIRRMSGGTFTLDDRLRLMMRQEHDNGSSDVEKQRERRMRRAGSKDSTPGYEDSKEGPGPAIEAENRIEHLEVANSPRLTRESILRRLASHQDLGSEYSDDGTPSPVHSTGAQLLDPDVPIPSLEDPTQIVVEEIDGGHVDIKQEHAEEQDLYAIPDRYHQQTHEGSDTEDDETSQYSQPSFVAHTTLTAAEGQATPRAQSPAREPEKKALRSEHTALPEFANFGFHESFNFGLDSYMTPSLPNVEKETDQPQVEEVKMMDQTRKRLESNEFPDLASLRAAIQRPGAPVEQIQPPQLSTSGNDSDFEPGTPDSVIRHPIQISPSQSPLQPLTPEIAEPEATIKAEDGRLKTRPSVTPADVETMAATRRQVSGQLESKRRVLECGEDQVSHGTESPPQRKSVSLDSDPVKDGETTAALSVGPSDKRVSSLVKLEIPESDTHGELGLGLEEEFDRVVAAQKVAFELSLTHLYHPFHGRFPPAVYPHTKDTPVAQNAQLLKPQGARAFPIASSQVANRSPGRQRGYLMRQNTKVVVATSAHNQDEPCLAPAHVIQEPLSVTTSPRKISQQTWVAEPWNGKSRRKSIRASGEISPRKKPVEGAVPPMPGQSSNVQDGLGAVNEDEPAEEEVEDFEDGTERGRLFVKVVGVKELDLPLPQGLSLHNFQYLVLIFV